MDKETAKRLKAKLKKLIQDNPVDCYRTWRFGLPQQIDPSFPGRASTMMATGAAESTTAGAVYPPHVGGPGPVVRRAGAHLVDMSRIWKPPKRRKRKAEDRGPGFPKVPLHPWQALSNRFPGTFR